MTPTETPRSIVVTGGAAGIGAAISAQLAAEGWHVVALTRSEHRDSRPDGVHYVIGDVRSSGDLEAAADAAEALAPLRGWVNNAAVIEDVALHEVDDAHIRTVLDINLVGTVLGVRTALRRFLASSTAGSIVNLSSIHGRGAFPGNPIYDTSKGGIEAITRYAAVEYGHLGIRTNSVAPGAIRTAMLQTVIDAAEDPRAAEADFSSLNVAGRLGESEEVADVVSFLLSSAASFVNGAIVPVDSGAAARVYAFPVHSSVPGHLAGEAGRDD